MNEYRDLTDSFLANLASHEREEIEKRRKAWGLTPDDFYPRLQSWFANFEHRDKPLALKIFLGIQYFSAKYFEQRILELRKPVEQFLSQTGGSIRDVLLVVPDERGDSADHHAYEVIKKWSLGQSQVLPVGELAKAANENSVLVFFNDTHGTGNQFLREVFAKIPQQKFKGVFVIAITIAEKALRRFQRELTGVHVVPGEATRGAIDSFTAAEFRRIRELGTKTYPAHPLGYGDAGLMTAYYFQCPNNTLPLIWADGENNAVDGVSFPWSALFPYQPKIKKPKPPESRKPDSTAPNAELLNPADKWVWTHEERVKIQARIADWGLASAEFYMRTSDWFANFDETERNLALDIFLATRYLDIQKVRSGIQWLHDKVLADILNAGGDIGDVLLVTTGDEKNSVYHYLFEFLRGWRLEVDQVCSIRDLTPDRVIDKTLVLFYHTRLTGHHFFNPQPTGLSYAERIRALAPRATFIAACAIAPSAIERFSTEFGKRVLFLKDPSETVARIVPEHLGPLATIETALDPAAGARDPNEELLVAYYFQCPAASSPLLWTDQSDVDGRRPWKPLFHYIQIPA